MGRVKGIISIPTVVKGGVSTKFTDKEADKCIINKCNRLLKDGSYTGFEIEVEDENGNIYEWIDRSLISSASSSVLRAAMKSHLTTHIDKDTDIEYGDPSLVEDPESIVGKNIAGVSQSA
jgi:hypothetical protein